MKALIWLLHGVRSDAAHMSELETGLRGALAKTQKAVQAAVHNRGYEWQRPAIHAALDEVGKLFRHKGDDPLVLVGHSQGGLVCRLLAACICEPDSLESGLNGQSIYLAGEVSAWRHRLRGLVTDPQRKQLQKRLRGVVMLATPNNGALTFGQLSLIGRAVSIGARTGLSMLSQANWDDLATDRLFQVLQHVSVKSIKYLSVSASGISRFSPLNQGDFALIPYVERLGVNLDLPNDRFVEDISVDLNEATWKPEIADLDRQYEHVKWYVGCGAQTHSTIHESSAVHEVVADRISGWL